MDIISYKCRLDISSAFGQKLHLGGAVAGPKCRWTQLSLDAKSRGRDRDPNVGTLVSGPNCPGRNCRRMQNS